MKRIQLILLLAVIASFVTACKDDEEPAPSVVGFWTGTYSPPSSSSFAMLFRSNGTVRIYANNADTSLAGKAEGTYTVSDSVRMTYTFIAPASGTYSAAGKLNGDATSMTGTWGEGTSTTFDGGVFTLTR